jgi:hypothetical protein
MILNYPVSCGLFQVGLLCRNKSLVNYFTYSVSFYVFLQEVPFVCLALHKFVYGNINVLLVI